MLCLQVSHHIFLAEDKTDLQSEAVCSFCSQLAQELFGIDALYFFFDKIGIVTLTFTENCEDKCTKAFR